MDLSIVILNYNTSGLLRQCLMGIKKFPPNLAYEVIVVDNASNDGTREMMRELFPDIKLIVSASNIGHAKGNNLGIKAARGKYIILLNTDIVVLEGAIQKMYDFMEEHSRVGIASAKLISPDKSIQASSLRFYRFLTPLYRRTFLGKLSFGKKELARFLRRDTNHYLSQPVDWVMSSCLIVRGAVLEKIGLMDERFFIYFADVDLCRRAWQAGFQVYYIAEARLVHYHRRESAEYMGLKSLISPLARIHILDWLRYLVKYRGIEEPR